MGSGDGLIGIFICSKRNTGVAAKAACVISSMMITVWEEQREQHPPYTGGE